MRAIDLRDKLHVWVTGYPRSGTTWISRTLARALLCPATGPVGSENEHPPPPGVEGLQRRSKYVVRRSHFGVDFHRHSHADHVTIAVIMAVRDPRDVAISAWHHFTFEKTEEDLARCVRQMCGIELGKPLLPDMWGGKHIPGWPGFVADWLDEGVPIIRFEDHLANPIGEVERLFEEIGLDVPTRRVYDAVDANTWVNRKKDRLMRKGAAGQWREELPNGMAAVVVEHCGSVMERLGYER